MSSNEDEDAVSAAERKESGLEGIVSDVDIRTLNTDNLDRLANQMMRARLVAQQARVAAAEVRAAATTLAAVPFTGAAKTALGYTPSQPESGHQPMPYPGSAALRAAAGRFGEAAGVRHAVHFGVPIQAGHLAVGAAPAADADHLTAAQYRKSIAARRRAYDAAQRRQEADEAIVAQHEQGQRDLQASVAAAEAKEAAARAAAAAKQEAADSRAYDADEKERRKLETAYLRQERQREQEFDRAVLAAEKAELKRTERLRTRQETRDEEMHQKARRIKMGRGYESERIDRARTHFAQRRGPDLAGVSPTAPSPWPDRPEPPGIAFTAGGIQTAVPIRGPYTGAMGRGRIPEPDQSGLSWGAIGSELKDFATNPAATTIRWITAAPFLGQLTFAIFATTAAAHLIEERIKAYFGPGGSGDIRKAVRDAAAQIDGLKELVDYRSGRIFFAASTRVEQAVPELTYTEGLRDGELRYRQLHQGSLI